MSKKKCHPFQYLMFAMVTFLTAYSQLDAQNSMGLKAGGNLSYLGPTFEEDYRERLGYTLGVTGHIKLFSNLYLNPEVNYTQRTFRFITPEFLDNTLDNTDLMMGLNYLDIPLNVGYGTYTKEEGGADMFLLFYGGPQFNFLLSQNNRFKATRGSNSVAVDPGEFKDIRNTDVGFNFGVNLGLNQWLFDLRYYFGFTSLFEFEKDADRMTLVSIAVSYRFISR